MSRTAAPARRALRAEKAEESGQDLIPLVIQEQLSGGNVTHSTGSNPELNTTSLQPFPLQHSAPSLVPSPFIPQNSPSAFARLNGKRLLSSALGYGTGTTTPLPAARPGSSSQAYCSLRHPGLRPALLFHHSCGSFCTSPLSLTTLSVTRALSFPSYRLYLTYVSSRILSRPSLSTDHLSCLLPHAAPWGVSLPELSTEELPCKRTILS